MLHLARMASKSSIVAPLVTDTFNQKPAKQRPTDHKNLNEAVDLILAIWIILSLSLQLLEETEVGMLHEKTLNVTYKSHSKFSIGGVRYRLALWYNNYLLHTGLYMLDRVEQIMINLVVVSVASLILYHLL